MKTKLESRRQSASARRGGAPLARAPIPPGDGDAHRARIAEVAYYIAEQRGFAPGRELDDWLEAERRVEGRYRV